MRTILPALVGLAVLGVTLTARSAQPASQADIASGEQVYARCAACHSLTENRTGPRHCGLLGRTAGTEQGYDYSKAMRRSGIVWNESTLDAFLRGPLEYVPGTTMTFVGVPDPEERAQLIAYLKRATVSPPCPPPEEASR